MKYSDRLPKTHELYWLEEFIERELGLATTIHENEHSHMMTYFNLEYRNVMPLNGQYDMDSKEWVMDREYHLKLHIKFWDMMNNHVDIVARFKAQFGKYSIEDITDPSVPEGLK
jgi:hypothetical protein